MKPFPKRVYVYWDGEDDDAILIAVERISEIPEDSHESMVATYDNSKVSSFQVTKELV